MVAIIHVVRLATVNNPMLTAAFKVRQGSVALSRTITTYNIFNCVRAVWPWRVNNSIHAFECVKTNGGNSRVSAL